MIPRFLLQRLYHRHRLIVLAVEPADRRPCPVDPDIEVHRRPDSLSDADRRIVLPHGWVNPMRHRFARGRATYLVLRMGGAVVAFGCIQSSRPFRRRMPFLKPSDLMLGPFWTHPAYRRRGFFGRLMNQTVATADPDRRIVGYTTPGNEAALRGMRKAGLVTLAAYDVTTLLLFARTRRVPVEPLTTERYAPDETA